MDMEQIVEIAKHNEKVLNELVISNTEFILRVAGSTTRRFIDKSSDEWSVALVAFNEAVNSYSPQKGNFHSFASLVIKRRLTDLLRKKTKSSKEIAVSPDTFSGNFDDSDTTDKTLHSEIIKKISYNPQNNIKYEILAISDTLKEYSITFSELATASPKVTKTKQSCADIICVILQNDDLLKSLRKNKALPIKKLEKNYKQHRKIMERHRKYIIAGVEILNGDYPHLSEYMRFAKDKLK